MSDITDDRLLAFLEGSMEEVERVELLDALDRDPELGARMRAAAVGQAALRDHAAGQAAQRDHAVGRAAQRDHAVGAATVHARATPAPRAAAAPGRAGVSPWWVAAAAAAAFVAAVPMTLWLSGRTAVSSDENGVAVGQPAAAAPSFVLVLQGRWPDAGTIAAGEAQARGREYWEWTTSLARDGLLVAAGDLRWEPGERLGPAGERVAVSADELTDTDYVVGMIALRVDSYEEALAVAERCPHLRYGGSVSVRRVGAGFVAVAGMSDWSD